MPKQQLINQYFKNSFKKGKFFHPIPMLPAFKKQNHNKQ